MGSQPTPKGSSAARLGAAEEALRKVQAQAAALEDLSEQLSLSVHVLEAEIGALAERLRTEAKRMRDEARLRAGGEAANGAGQPTDASAPSAPEPTAPTRSADAEGARLVALNMALDGEPREAADRYLAEHFDIADRERLLDEVYAAAGR
jgi:hypothetical protein